MALEKVIADGGFLNNKIIRRVQGSAVYYEIFDQDSMIFSVQVEDTVNVADPLDIAIILYDMILHDESLDDVTVIDDSSKLIHDIIANRSNDVATNIVRNIMDNYEEANKKKKEEK